MLQVVPSDETTAPVNPTFDDFWCLYPKRVAKKDAARAWSRLSREKQVEALVGLAAWIPVWTQKTASREDFLDYLPYPASWINGERWEDELPQAYRNRPLAHRPVENDPAPDTAKNIPPHVQEMIRKFKERAKR